jgi:hypothetical protein
MAFVQGIVDTYSGRLIYSNYQELDDGVFGSFANKQEQSFIYQVRKLNYSLMQILPYKGPIYLSGILRPCSIPWAGLFGLIPHFM